MNAANLTKNELKEFESRKSDHEIMEKIQYFGHNKTSPDWKPQSPSA